MPNAIAFFPWIITDEPTTIGPIRLIPYLHSKSPGDTAHVKQSDIDNVLSAYANRSRSRVKSATLLEFGDWYSGMDAKNARENLFRSRDAIAFAALSHRRLFSRLSGYCNYDSYALTIQRYATGEANTFAFITRRRDGGSHQIWSSDSYAFYRPIHVESPTRLAVDRPLLQSLLSLPQSSPLIEAAVEFNAANTDSYEVPAHVEIVMVKSAFEWLLGIDEKVSEFVRALRAVLMNLGPLAPGEGPITSQWNARWQNSSDLWEAWARDLCRVRGAAAHGKDRSAEDAVWSAECHLAFSAIFFPLLFKKVLGDRGLLKLDTFDVERLKLTNQYLAHDPFAFDDNGEEFAHPWIETDTRALVHAKAHLFYPEMK